MQSISAYLQKLARPSTAAIIGIVLATNTPVPSADAAVSKDVAIGLGVFHEPAKQIAAKADNLLNNELLKHYKKEDIVPGIVSVKTIPSGHVRYLDTKPASVKVDGKMVGAIASYFEVHARIKLDADLTFDTRKIAAVNTEQIVEVLTIPRLENGVPVVDIKAKVISATARKEREAKQKHADQFRDRVRDAVNAELKKHANRSFSPSSLAGGRLVKAGAVNLIEVYDSGVRAALGKPSRGYARDASSKRAKNPGKVYIYEHEDYRGKECTLDLRFYRKGVIYTIPKGFPNDAMSSLEGNLNGVTIIFYEHANGGGRQYKFTGNGSVKDRSLRDNDFNDKWTSWKYVD